MQGLRTRRGVLAVIAAVIGATICGCASAPAATGGVAQAATVTAAHGKGCPPTSGPAPRWETTSIGDVDGDGRPDRQFYSLQTPTYGIRTASGATIVASIRIVVVLPAPLGPSTP